MHSSPATSKVSQRYAHTKNEIYQLAALFFIVHSYSTPFFLVFLGGWKGKEKGSQCYRPAGNGQGSHLHPSNKQHKETVYVPLLSVYRAEKGERKKERGERVGG